MPLSIRLAVQQLLSHWRGGDLRVLMLALVLAIASITTVSAFSQRVLAQLNAQGGMLLGGDLVIKSDHALTIDYAQQAKALGIKTSQTAEFASMLIAGELNQLVEVKALDAGFPFRGDFDVRLSHDGTVQTVQTRPNVSEVWIEPRLAQILNVTLGDTVELGAKTFKVSGILMRESSRGGDMFSFAPRLMMHWDDLAATELIQYGSRVKYQLVLSGNPQAISKFQMQVAPFLQRGEHIEDIKTARPEIKSALDKAEIFLGLAAMVSVILAIVAMLLASGPFVSRNLDTFAMLRCFGGSNQFVQSILLWQTLLIALIGGLVGIALGYVAQHGLAVLMGQLLVSELGALSIQPFLFGFLISILVMLALMWPYLNAIKHCTIIHILRRELEVNLKQDVRNYIPIAIIIFGLIIVFAKTVKMALIMSIGLLLTSCVVAIFAYFIIQLLFKASFKHSSSTNAAIQLGVNSLKRHLRLSIAQMIAFSLALTVLILLSIIRIDLMKSWQDSLPPDAPNRFVINIQKEQIPTLEQMFADANLAKPDIFPMIRGRLTAINHNNINPAHYPNERAKRLAEREFNLSMANKMQSDNKLLEGRWWRADETGNLMVSIEQDIARNLNIHLGDILTYDIAGTPLELKVTSIRKVEWDSMRANFFAVTPPNVLDAFLASYITAFYLPNSNQGFIDKLVKRMNNLTVIDVAAIMTQVRDIMHRMTTALGYVFLLSVVSGFALLYAALVATKSSRIYEASLLRALGATKKQVGLAMMAEFFCIALVSIIVALILANLIAFAISHYLLDIPYLFNLKITLSSSLSALLLIPLAAWWVIKHFLNLPPKQLLNSI